MKTQFTQKQQEEIFKRDKRCKLCGTTNNLFKPHHVFFGTHRPKGWKKGDNINGIWNGSLLCIWGHSSLHITIKSCNGKSREINRKHLEDIAQERFDKLKK